MTGPILQTALIAVLGAGIFLRLVAKEKNRRERHLQFRLDEQVRKFEEERELERKKAEKAKLQDDHRDEEDPTRAAQPSP